MIQVLYAGRECFADVLTSGSETFYQIDGEFIPSSLVHVVGQTVFSPELPPPPPSPNPGLSSGLGKSSGKPPKNPKGPPPKVDGDTDPPAGGGDLSAPVADPRNR